jgi:toxin ParE1/3/4
VKVRYTRRAFHQMNTILDHIEDHSPQDARHVKQRLQAAVELVAAHPHSGPLIGRRDLRRVVVNPYPYFIFYRIMAETMGPIRPGAGRPVAALFNQERIVARAWPASENRIAVTGLTY